MLDATCNFTQPLSAERLYGWQAALFPSGRSSLGKITMLLARSDSSTQRFYSLSAQIQKERKDYYHILEQTQKGPLDITRWLEWFLRCFQRALVSSEALRGRIPGKARFWKKHKDRSFNERQRLMLHKLLDGFESKLTSSKWALIAKCSQDTAARDISQLLNLSR